jgi:UDP-N-acetylenolpyruvoylglucosamine reductase
MPQNANYIANLGGATATDIATLIIEAHHSVLTRLGMNMALNIDFLGAWPQNQ